MKSRTLKYPPAWIGNTEEDEGKENAPEENAQVEPLKEGDTKQSQESTITTEQEATDKSASEKSLKNENDKEPNKENVKSVNQSEKPDEISIKPADEPLPAAPSSQPDKSGDVVSEDSKDKPLSEINGELDNEPKQLPLPPKKPVITLNRIFHDDSLKTFCRRLSCSPRGELMIVPGGLLPPVPIDKSKDDASRQSTPAGDEDEESKEKEKASKRFDSEQNNAAIIFCRNSWSYPCAVIPTGVSYSIAAKFNPVYFQRDREPYEYGTNIF